MLPPNPGSCGAVLLRATGLRWSICGRWLPSAGGKAKPQADSLGAPAEDHGGLGTLETGWLPRKSKGGKAVCVAQQTQRPGSAVPLTLCTHCTPSEPCHLHGYVSRHLPMPSFLYPSPHPHTPLPACLFILQKTLSLFPHASP